MSEMTKPRKRALRRSPLALALGMALVAGLLLLPGTAGAQTSGPDDTFYPEQWGVRQVNAPQAWATSTGAGEVIAIVDSGVDLDHPDLRGHLVAGATFRGCAENGPCGNGDWQSGKGPHSDHGTHVAGIAAASTGNGIGVAGVARDASIMPVKVLDSDGGSFAEIAAGIDWAVANGADVVNLSLGALPGVQALTVTGVIGDVRESIDRATAAGVVVVAAAGNDFASICGSPSFDADALCVVATDRNEVRAAYSNFGVAEDLDVVAAPGGAAFTFCEDDIVSTVPSESDSFCEGNSFSDGYDGKAGTSMAAPHVAGVAALLTAQGRGVGEVTDALTSTARQPVTGVRGVYNPVYGYGIVDAAAAVAS